MQSKAKLKELYHWDWRFAPSFWRDSGGQHLPFLRPRLAARQLLIPSHSRQLLELIFQFLGRHRRMGLPWCLKEHSCSNSTNLLILWFCAYLSQRVVRSSSGVAEATYVFAFAPSFAVEARKEYLLNGAEVRLEPSVKILMLLPLYLARADALSVTKQNYILRLCELADGYSSSPSLQVNVQVMCRFLKSRGPQASECVVERDFLADSRGRRHRGSAAV